MDWTQEVEQKHYDLESKKQEKETQETVKKMGRQNKSISWKDNGLEQPEQERSRRSSRRPLPNLDKQMFKLYFVFVRLYVTHESE